VKALLPVVASFKSLNERNKQYNERNNKQQQQQEKQQRNMPIECTFVGCTTKWAITTSRYKGKKPLCHVHVRQRNLPKPAEDHSEDLEKETDSEGFDWRERLELRELHSHTHLTSLTQQNDDTEEEVDTDDDTQEEDSQDDESDDGIEATHCNIQELLYAVPGAEGYFGELLKATPLMDPSKRILELCRQLKADRTDVAKTVYRDVKAYLNPQIRDWNLCTLKLDGLIDITQEVRTIQEQEQVRTTGDGPVNGGCKYFEAPIARAILIEWPARLSRATYIFQWGEGLGHDVGTLSRQTLITRLCIFAANIDALPRAALWENLKLADLATGATATAGHDAGQNVFLTQVTKAEQRRLGDEGGSGASGYEHAQCVGEIRLVEYTGYCLRVYHLDQESYTTAIKSLVTEPSATQSTLCSEGRAFRERYSTRSPVVVAKREVAKADEPVPPTAPTSVASTDVADSDSEKPTAEVESAEESEEPEEPEEPEESELVAEAGVNFKKDDLVEIVANNSPENVKGRTYRVSAVGKGMKVRLLTFEDTTPSGSTTPQAGWYAISSLRHVGAAAP
jgi:hypothetical protein